MRSRAIIAGIFSFSLLFTLVVVLLNTLHDDAANAAQLSAYVLIWVVPGYVSALFAGRRGVFNSFVTGVIIGIASAVGLIAALQGRVEIPFSAAEIFLGITCAAAALSTLGGLVGRLQLRRR